MGRELDDYLAGASEDEPADSSLLGYLQLTGETQTMRLTESQQPARRKEESDGAE